MSNYQIKQTNQQLHAGFFKEDPFKQKESQILVLKTAIAGMQFYLDRTKQEDNLLLNSLEPGVELKLYRDFDNEHDEWAIAVFTLEDKQIGHVTRYKNETIARLMDVGKKFVAYIDEPEVIDDEDRTKAPTENNSLPFSIYLVE